MGEASTNSEGNSMKPIVEFGWRLRGKFKSFVNRISIES